MALVFTTIASVVACCCAAGAPIPFGLRTDLALSDAPFISLDAIAGLSPNVTLTWQLPVEIPTQSSYSVTITRSDGSAVWSSGSVKASAQIAYAPRSVLQPASRYSWSVAVNDGASSVPIVFFTSAPPSGWDATAPIWAPVCQTFGPSAPAFARFIATPSIPASSAVDSALLYVTGAPPVYNDPWNVTKLLGGYFLSLNGSRIGVGPGRTACGPYAMGPCAPIQPVDGYDVTSAVQEVGLSRLWGGALY
jgi:hypothetical protein